MKGNQEAIHILVKRSNPVPPCLALLCFTYGVGYLWFKASSQMKRNDEKQNQKWQPFQGEFYYNSCWSIAESVDLCKLHVCISLVWVWSMQKYIGKNNGRHYRWCSPVVLQGLKTYPHRPVCLQFSASWYRSSCDPTKITGKKGSNEACWASWHACSGLWGSMELGKFASPRLF